MRTCPDCEFPVGEQTMYCDNCGLLLTSDSSQPSTPGKKSGPVPPPEKSQSEPVSGLPAVENAAPGTCSACGFSNVPGEMFCQNCGVQLAPVASAPPPPPVPTTGAPAGKEKKKQAAPAKTKPDACPSCGHVNPEGEQYCQTCGFELSAQALQQQVAPLVLDAAQDEAVSEPAAAAAAEAPSKPLPEDQPETGQKPASKDRKATGNLDQVPGKLILQATKAEIMIPTGKSEIKMGRTDPVRDIYPEIDLSEHGGEAGGVSRLHARLVVEGPYTYLEDLNSTNFTFLNRQKLQPGQPYLIQDGDEIRLGLLIMHYHIA